MNLTKGFWLHLSGAGAAGGLITLAAFASFYFPSYWLPCVLVPIILISGIIRAIKFELKHGQK